MMWIWHPFVQPLAGNWQTLATDTLAYMLGRLQKQRGAARGSLVRIELHSTKYDMYFLVKGKTACLFDSLSGLLSESWVIKVRSAEERRAVICFYIMPVF